MSVNPPTDVRDDDGRKNKRDEETPSERVTRQTLETLLGLDDKPPSQIRYDSFSSGTGPSLEEQMRRDDLQREADLQALIEQQQRLHP